MLKNKKSASGHSCVLFSLNKNFSSNFSELYSLVIGIARNIRHDLNLSKSNYGNCVYFY